jgi:hypothetical protein
MIMQVKSWLRVIPTHVTKWIFKLTLMNFVLELIALNLKPTFFIKQLKEW